MNLRGLCTLLLVGLCACGENTSPLALDAPDRMQFELAVYPVLLRDCAFPTCHASGERFFQVFGPGRARLDAMTKVLDPATPAELDHAYQRAVSMIDAAQPDRSLLLRKPLASAAGGSGHEGADELGRNVYSSKTAPNYIVLHDWVFQQTGAQGTAGTAPTR